MQESSTLADRAALAGRPLSLRSPALNAERRKNFESYAAKHVERELLAERKRNRSAARSRCRARALKEAAQSFLERLPKDRAELERLSTLSDDVDASNAVIRPLTPLELGLMYHWMEADEAIGSGDVTRWWSGGAVGLQQAWELSSGWYDDELEEPSAWKVRQAAASIDQLVAFIESHGWQESADHLLGEKALVDHLPQDEDRPPRTPHFVGAFLPRHLSPLAFAATKSPDRRAPLSTTWMIDSIGTSLAARSRGLGTALAHHCIGNASAIGDTEEYRIDVIPSALSFWSKLGFKEAVPDAEQAFFLSRGGDRPMTLSMLCRRAT
jgi:GNAT superfamily N-acetyltransferase